MDIFKTLNKQPLKYSMIFFVLLISFALFYWFQIRPSAIRKDCYEYAYGTPNLGNTDEWVKATNYYFEACLHRNGLK